MLKTICVYCGSSVGTDPFFRQEAIHFARLLVENNIRLVNGGGNIGLMGVMADTMLISGGECIGVIPLGLKQKEVAHTGMTDLIVVPDMHSRKLTMVNLSDAFVAFPGGFGTLDEVFETLTWAQLHLHQKPVLLFNPKGFFDDLIRQADRMVAEGFLNISSRSLLMSTDNIENILPMLQHFKVMPADKWSFVKEE